MNPNPTLLWTLEELKAALSNHPKVKGWTLSKEHVHRRERYFMKDKNSLVIDQDREVDSQSLNARIFVRLDGKTDRQGEVSKKFFQSLPLQPQIDTSIEAASQTDFEAWNLPTEIPSELPQLETADPRIAEDLENCISQLSQRVQKSVEKNRPSQFNSAELFVSVHHRETHLSNGLIHRGVQSRAYTEAAYSFRKKDSQGEWHSDEYMNTRWAVSLNDFPLEELFDETAERAEASLLLKKPKTNSYSVLVDDEVLALLFNNIVSQLSASNKYNGLPFLEVGKDLIEGATHDLITLKIDPTLPFGADTTALSEQGLKQAPLTLVENNQIVTTSTDQRYGRYLKLDPTTVRGDVVVLPGKMTCEELKKSENQVLEILQFSGLFADANSGTFSSEIRLARLYDNRSGEVTYLKGGSLSGSIRENFKALRLSQELAKNAHFSGNSGQGRGYLGPKYALLSHVSVVG